MTQTPLKRYYDDQGTTHPDVDTTALGKTLHALYTHWVRNHGHRRDFELAAGHDANLLYAEWAMQHKPNLVGVEVPPSVEVPLAIPRQNEGLELRFYDEVASINLALDIFMHRKALIPHFLAWGSAGFAPRDFAAAVEDVCRCVVYDHELAMSMGGLGGGKTGQEFLTTPYKA